MTNLEQGFCPNCGKAIHRHYHQGRWVPCGTPAPRAPIDDPALQLQAVRRAPRRARCKVRLTIALA